MSSMWQLGQKSNDTINVHSENQAAVQVSRQNTNQ